MRERCLRTVLISPIRAPERSSARVTACFSASARPCAGAIQLAEAPPDISTSTRSSAPRCRRAPARARRRRGRPGPAPDGRLRSSGCARSAAHSRAARPRCPASRVGGKPRRGNAASATSAIEPAALPAASMISRPRCRRRRQDAAAGSAPDAPPRPLCEKGLRESARRDVMARPRARARHCAAARPRCRAGSGRRRAICIGPSASPRTIQPKARRRPLRGRSRARRRLPAGCRARTRAGPARRPANDRERDQRRQPFADCGSSRGSSEKRDHEQAGGRDRGRHEGQRAGRHVRRAARSAST